MTLTSTKSNSQQLDYIFLSDLISSSHATPYNYIFYDVGLEIQCWSNACEKYGGTTNVWEERGSSLFSHHMSSFDSYDRQHGYMQEKIMNIGSSRRDVSIIRFSTTSPSEKKESQLVLTEARKYNMKSYIMILTRNEEEFEESKDFILSQKMYNIFIVRRSKEPDTLVVYQVCAYCDDGITQINVYNTWRLGHGLKNPMEYENSFKGKFNGAMVKLGLIPLVPSVFPIRQNIDGSPVYTGSEYEVMEILAKYLHFKPIIIIPTDKGGCTFDGSKAIVGYCKLEMQYVYCDI